MQPAGAGAAARGLWRWGGGISGLEIVASGEGRGSGQWKRKGTGMTNMFRAVVLARRVLSRIRAEGKYMVVERNWGKENGVVGDGGLRDDRMERFLLRKHRHSYTVPTPHGRVHDYDERHHHNKQPDLRLQNNVADRLANLGSGSSHARVITHFVGRWKVCQLRLTYIYWCGSPVWSILVFHRPSPVAGMLVAVLR